MGKARLHDRNFIWAIQLRGLWRLRLLMLFACSFACSPQTQVSNSEAINGSVQRETSVKIVRLLNRDEFSKLPNITEQELLSIAKKTLRQNFNDVGPRKVVLCESVLFWHVLYEELGVEFVISKDRQEVLVSRKLPFPLKRDQLGNTISESRAIAIANDETRSYLDSSGAVDELGNFHSIVCELENSWRIYYVDTATWDSKDWNNLPNSHSPDYLIDKEDGRILYRSYDVRSLPE